MYADDSACASMLKETVLWLKLLIAEGPKYGYHPEPDKSYLIVHPDWVEEANKLFCEFKVNVVTGHRFLGGFVGRVEETEKWIHKKVQVWSKAIQNLSKAAQSQPHLPYISFTKSLQNEWSYIQ